MQLKESHKISIGKGLIVILLILLVHGNSYVLLAQVDTEFWFVVPELSHRGNTGGTPGTVRIATMELPATVTISMPANAYHATLNPAGFQDIVIDIPANSTAAVDLSHLIDVAALPVNNRLENKPLTPDGINDFGLHITATNMITAYWEVNYDFGSDLWTLKGTNGIGTLFYTPFQTVYNNRNLTPRTYSAIDIVATQDNTQVTITLPPGKAASFGSMLTPIAPGGTYTLTLNRGQTFSLFPLNYSVLAADRLAGTRIESTEPISVTVKDDAIASGSQGQDLVGDQLVPVNIIGDNYLVPEVNNPNHVYVLATEDNTDIYVYDALGLPIGPVPYTTLNAGEQALVVVPGGSKYARITSRTNPVDPPKPFYTFQMGIENQSRGGAIIPAIGCTGNTQVAFTRAREDNKFYFFIIVEKGNEDKFLIDGVRNDGIIDPGAFTEIQGSGGWVALFSNSINSNTLTVGQHLVKNTGGIFHLGILNGFPGAAQGRLYYGYYSDFGGLNVGANVAGTNSSVVRACYGDPVQLYAYGGTNYQWTPDTYLDDATSNLPTATNLPPGPHNYQVAVSGACSGGTVDLTILVSSPVKAFFETNVSSGCSPLNLELEDQSSGVYSWQYDMGDGTPLIRYDLDPATPYPEPPGFPQPFNINHTYTNTTDSIIQYEITLLVKNESGCSDILRKNIAVFPEISSDFSVAGNNYRGCEPLLVQFQNNSSGNTDTWVWEFGDGGSSIEENPQHTFTNLFGPDSIVYQTRLIAISPYYCRDTSYHDITVMPYIEANFAFDTVTACTPHEIRITDQSYGADIYSWDFGDGTTSSSSGPSFNKIYQNTTTNPVTHTIHLRVDNEEGCFDEIQREVVVYPEVISSFTASTDEGCSPFEVFFQNNSNGADKYFWDFGDGGTSTEINPVHRYERNMMDHDTVYRVTLIATSDEICTDTSYFDVVIHPYIEAAFTVEDIIGCHPFTVTINNQSTGADHYEWDFGDGSPLSAADTSVFTHNYYNTTGTAATYTLRLIVTNDQGCSDTLSRQITVHPELSANFTTDGFEGCHPMEVTFTDLSLNAEIWYWDFGDGSSSVDPSPVHTFNNFGTGDTTYMVSLTTSTADGECIKTVSWPILVHPNVEAEFTFPDAFSCNPFEVTFDNLSVGGTQFLWDFGDGATLPVADNRPVSHIFTNSDFTNMQSYVVRLRAENDAGCFSEITKTVTVYPDIQTRFDASATEGCHPLEVDFTNQTSGGATYLWDFGDGSHSAQSNPDHLFTNTGTIDSVYSVSLISIAPNNECRDTFSVDIIVHPYVKADFNIADFSGCNPFEVNIDNASVNGSVFRWDFGDGTDTITDNLNPLTHIYYNADFANPAEYRIILTAENFAGCTDEITKTVNVQPDINADFTVDRTIGCHPLEVEFTNLSGGAAYYSWDFGDGTTGQVVDPLKTFINTGTADTTYEVWLYSMAANHECKDSSFMNITVHPYIKGEFTTEDNIHCSPSTISFDNSSVGAVSYNWDFGDGTDSVSSSPDPVNHVFVNPDFDNNHVFRVVMTAENAAGCISRFEKDVEVYPSIRADYIQSTGEGCHPLNVEFTNSGSGGYTYFWDFGDGSTSEAASPVHNFTNFSDSVIRRQVHLQATSRYNCTNEISSQLVIHPKPKARFETDRIIACPPFNVSLTNTSLNADDYAWDFGDGEVTNTSSLISVAHEYINTGNEIAEYNLNMIASSTYGCADTSLQKIFVYPAATADFSSNQEGCSPLVAYFMNESTNGDSYYWDFGDGSNMTTQDPANVFFNFSDRDTVFHINLTTTTKYGCVDSKQDSVIVYAQPAAEFIADPTHQYFPSASVNIDNETNAGDWDYLWDLGDGYSTDEEYPGPHDYDHWGDYEIRLHVSSPHCRDSVTHTVRIFPAAPKASFDPLTPGCAPHTIQFANHSSYGDSYLWEFDDGTKSTEFQPVHTFESPGFYNVKLTVEGEGGRDYAYQQVEVFRNPKVDFRVVPDLVMLPDDELKAFNMSEHGVSFIWDFGDGSTSTEENPVHQYDKTGTYDIRLDVWTENGCTNSLLKAAAVEVEAEGMIVYPNAFKPDRTGPNGGYYELDGIERNNVFHPYWKGVVDYRMDIYSRWGELLFTSFDVNIGWDGYMDGKPIKQGVYVYKATGTFINGKRWYRVGDVTLVH